MILQATTAMFPGWALGSVLEALDAGIQEPLGAVATEHVQLCPQTPTTLTEAVCEQIMATYPGTRFRTHANARVVPGLHLLDIARYDEHSRPYFQALADRARRLGAPAVSLHAGYRHHATLAQMLDRRARIQDLFGDIPVAVEGLYPHTRRPQLVDTWHEYETLWRAQVPMAVDVSHLQIVATAEGDRQEALMRELLASPHTLEIHVSDNDGHRDAHAIAPARPWWHALVQTAQGPNAIVFTEGNHTQRLRARCVSSRKTTSAAALAAQA